MANDLNQCNFIGRLGRDPETRYNEAGNAMTNFSIACGWKGKDKEGTEWVRLVAFGRLAEIIDEYAHKGKQVFVSGRQQTRKWQDKEGNDRYSTEVVVNQFQLLGSKGDGSSRRDENENQDYDSSSAKHGPTTTGDDFDNDIPF